MTRKKLKIEALIRKAWEFDYLAKDAAGVLRIRLQQAAEDIRKTVKEASWKA